ncbi:RNI-like protein [Auriculariales sp. MPI-PUGE-AT-0066]|nr:RNI-like protein [Auriculariales sp. MPI-PUGE-AT-0066]
MPPKRKTSIAERNSTSKRRRTDGGARQFGAAASDDERPFVSTAGATATHSTRRIWQTTPPTLANIALRVAAMRIQDLWRPSLEMHTKAMLKELPPDLIPRLFAQLQIYHPTILKSELIVTYFVPRSPQIVLTGSLTGATSQTIRGIAEYAPSDLRLLELSGLPPKVLSDTKTKGLFQKLPRLEVLILRESKGVGPVLVTAAATHCPKLKQVNLNDTQASTESVVTLLSSCKRLQTLKLAGIPHLSKTGLKPILNYAKDRSGYRNLLSYFPHLRRLDISYTTVHFNTALVGGLPPALEKLIIRCTPTTGPELSEVIPHFKQLRTLDIGALGPGGKGTVAMLTGSIFSLTPPVLRQVTNALASFEHLERMSLAANLQITAFESDADPDEPTAVQDFIRRVGRRCKYLDMSDNVSLKGSDFLYLVPDPEAVDFSLAAVSNLEHLKLSNTKLDDEVADCIASCTNLRILDLEATHISVYGYKTAEEYLKHGKNTAIK